MAAAVLGVFVFAYKNKVLALEKKLDSTKDKIVKNEKNIKVLKAEIALFTDPLRIKKIISSNTNEKWMSFDTDRTISISELPYNKNFNSTNQSYAQN